METFKMPDGDGASPSPSTPPSSPTPPKSRFYSSVSEVPAALFQNFKRVGAIPYVKLAKPHVLESASLGSAANRFEAAFEERIRDENAAASSDDIWFALGIDAKFSEITDCGGWRKPGESVYAAAARELFEESFRIFDIRSCAERRLASAPVIAGTRTCIFFIDVSVSLARVGFPERTPRFFREMRESALSSGSVSADFLENSALYWIGSKDLRRLAKSRTVAGSASALPIPAWQSKTRAEVAAATGSENHPRVYETVRRLLSPGADALFAHIRADHSKNQF